MNDHFQPDIGMLCDDLGITLKELGSRLNPPANKSDLSRWNRGLRPIPSYRITQLAQALGRTEAYIKAALQAGAEREQRRLQHAKQGNVTSVA